MSEALDAISAGFDELLGMSSEQITFRGQSFKWLVNRAPKIPTDDKRTPTFSEREYVVVALKRSDLSPLPRSGETGTDGNGHTLRVVWVEPRGAVYYLHCKLTAVTPGE